jgi:hypothetical protein
MQNITTQNGVDVTYAMNKHFTVGGYVSRFDVVSGIKWYIPSYNEIGFKLSKLTSHNSIIYNHFTGSIGYLFGAHEYQGVNVTMGVNF